MSEQSKLDLRNAMVFALCDGNLDEEEKRYLWELRARLGVDEAEFRALAEEVRRNPKRMTVPEGAGADESFTILAETAKADGVVSAEELQLLRRLADKMQLPIWRVDALIGQSPAEADQSQDASRRTDEIYRDFAKWDEPTRSARLAELAGLGRRAVLSLLHMLESYRVPDGLADALALKILAAENLGRLGDDSAVYYLAQQVDIGDMDDDITSLALRAAAAQAIGQIVGASFTSDQTGINAARLWWRSPARKAYDRLAF